MVSKKKVQLSSDRLVSEPRQPSFVDWYVQLLNRTGAVTLITRVGAETPENSLRIYALIMIIKSDVRACCACLCAQKVWGNR